VLDYPRKPEKCKDLVFPRIFLYLVKRSTYAVKQAYEEENPA